jgi:hypothetical protein
MVNICCPNIVIFFICNLFYLEISADYLKKEFENVDNLNDHKTSLISNTRHYRPDSLLKYPFVDSSTVNDVLHEKDVKINCLNMNGPALRHLIKQVHDNFKIGSSGFRISDLSNAFEVYYVSKYFVIIVYLIVCICRQWDLEKNMNGFITTC